MHELLCEILSICYKITHGSNAVCMFNYSGHVDQFHVLYFKDGWQDMSNEEFRKHYIVYYENVTEENLQIAIYRLRNIAQQLGVEL